MFLGPIITPWRQHEEAILILRLRFLMEEGSLLVCCSVVDKDWAGRLSTLFQLIDLHIDFMDIECLTFLGNLAF